MLLGMPTSRNRSSRNRSNRSVRRERARRARVGRSRGSAQLSEQDLAHLHESFAAEAAGDAARALAHHEAIPRFAESPHRVMLQQLVELGGAVPAWGHARWILEQVTRWITTDTLARNHLAREDTIRAAHTVGVDPRGPYGLRVEEFCGLLLGHDWIHRQLVVFEYDGLRDFLDSDAGPELVARAGPIDAWARVTMGAYRFEGEGRGRATFTDLCTGSEIDVMDLGSAGQLLPGDCAIGRVVPIDVEPGWMFEALPLSVDSALAARVAAAPDSWLTELTSAHEADRLPPLYSWREQHPLLTDVPVWVWRGALDGATTVRRGHDSVVASDIAAEGVGFCLGMLPLWAQVPTAGEPCVAQLFGSAVLHPGVMSVLRDAATGARNEQAWRGIAAAHLVDPMRGRVLELADLCSQRPDVA